MMSDNKQTIRDFGRYAQIVFVRAYEAQNGETRWPKTGDTVEIYGKTYAFKFVPKRLKSGKTGVKPLACKVDGPSADGIHVKPEPKDEPVPAATEDTLPF